MVSKDFKSTSFKITLEIHDMDDFNRIKEFLNQENTIIISLSSKTNGEFSFECNSDEIELIYKK